MTKNKPRICVVGGGTAGWITLAYLASTVDADLTIIHSDEIDIIGVGESTTPTIKHVAETCGVDEFTWMRDGQATFKYGLHFKDWNRAGSSWFHCFDDMIPEQNWTTSPFESGKRLSNKQLTSVEYYLKKYKKDSEFFNRSQGSSYYLWQHKLSPYNRLFESNVSRYPGYSYHINAFNFGNSLRRNIDSSKYREIVNTIVDVRVNEQGIDSLLLKDGQEIRADLYFDCSGFAKLLIGKFSEWNPYEGLINDRAVFGPVRGRNSDDPSTTAHAQPVGWIWVTPTWGNTGSGYVYSSHHMSEDQAVEHMRSYWRKQGYTWELNRSLKFQSGRQRYCSIKNVVANGLSQSFVEPLEATAIMVTCSTIVKFVELYKRNNNKIDDGLIRLHAKVIEKFLSHMKNFVVYHYRLTDRNDTGYWRDVQDVSSVEAVSQKIKELFSSPWLEPGETAFNQWNWASMLLGYEKPYTADLPEISDLHLEYYKNYTNNLINSYEQMLSTNIPISELLRHIHEPNAHAR